MIRPTFCTVFPRGIIRPYFQLYEPITPRKKFDTDRYLLVGLAVVEESINEMDQEPCAHLGLQERPYVDCRS
jgi:hypothetical protein